MNDYLKIWAIVSILIFSFDLGSSLQAFFHRTEGKYLANNVIRTEQTASELDCAALCSRESSCESVNYKMSGKKKGLCELNSKTLEAGSEEDEREISEFINLRIIDRVSSKIKLYII